MIIGEEPLATRGLIGPYSEKWASLSESTTSYFHLLIRERKKERKGAREKEREKEGAREIKRERERCYGPGCSAPLALKLNVKMLTRHAPSN